MLRKLFYRIKPFISRQLQLYLRRKLVTYELNKYKNVWPILKGSEKPPKDWKGWPDDKKFAVILTHDVEHQRGYDRVLKLIQIEKDLGFVSSFNFVPERDYKVEKEMLKALKQNGFEYGVHGLYHDGKLFSSEKEFLKRAKKINVYLKDWDTVGFRAPSMLHDLDLIGELDIEYDLSTFDTDPFEPQPDGVGTIFPFWVENKRHKNGGYVEMPYTLPQDFTPFILMSEYTPKIWIDKLDWIAKNGGMVLVNVHPDYIQFKGDAKGLEDFPISLYQDFLKYLLKNYNGQFWNVLPNEAARFVRESVKSSADFDNQETSKLRIKSKKILMVVYSEMPQDTRVRREAEALVEAGYKVDVICNMGKSKKIFETFKGINIYRLKLKPFRGNKFHYVNFYLLFFIKAFFKLNLLNLKNRYDVFHVHNMPDFLVFLPFIQKLLGKIIVLDLHDPMPEVFLTKFATENVNIKIINFFERVSFKFANKVITTNKAFVDAFKLRGNDISKLTIIMNSPQTNLFNIPDPKRSEEDKSKFIIMYHGTIVKRHGLEDAVNSVPKLLERIPNLEFWIFGSGEYSKNILERINYLEMDKYIKYFGPVMLDEIARTIPLIDVGIIPNQLNPFTQINFPVRIFEYLHFKKPVVVPKTIGILDYFDENSINYFKPGDYEDMINVIYNIFISPVESQKIVSRAFKVYENHNWEIEKKKLYSLYRNL